MAVRDILLLGNLALYQVCDPVTRDELAELSDVFRDLQDTLLAFRERHRVGRAIAAPQIGVAKRVVFLQRASNARDVRIGGLDTPTPLINPVLVNASKAVVELWDDCMSFPDLLVRVKRHEACDLVYRDADWRKHRVHLTGDLSELLQHECDHLNGILAVARAIDGQSFAYKREHVAAH